MHDHKMIKILLLFTFTLVISYTPVQSPTEIESSETKPTTSNYQPLLTFNSSNIYKKQEFKTYITNGHRHAKSIKSEYGEAYRIEIDVSVNVIVNLLGESAIIGRQGVTVARKGVVAASYHF